jgi:RNA polymerase sigma factor (sigma-70 family)
MSADDALDFDELIQRVRAGSQEAAWELIRRYSSHVMRVIRRRLPDKLRSKFDSQDFVQSAWAALFEHRSRLGAFTDANDFVRFLAGIASNKVKMEVRRRFHSRKYDVRRERRLDDSATGLGERLSAREATPSAVAIARERWFQLLADQPAHYQRIIELRYAGLDIREIARKLSLHEGTIQRVLRRMFQELSA